MQRLEDLLFVENKPVTYKWLSFDLSISANDAKRLLTDFVSAYGARVTTRFIVSGKLRSREKGGDPSKKGSTSRLSNAVRLVTKDRLEDEKRLFSKIHSEHVYSVEPRALTFEDEEAAKMSSSSPSAAASPSKRRRMSDDAPSSSSSSSLPPVAKPGKMEVAKPGKMEVMSDDEDDDDSTPPLLAQTTSVSSHCSSLRASSVSKPFSIASSKDASLPSRTGALADGDTLLWTADLLKQLSLSSKATDPKSSLFETSSIRNPEIRRCAAPFPRPKMFKRKPASVLAPGEPKKKRPKRRGIALLFEQASAPSSVDHSSRAEEKSHSDQSSRSENDNSSSSKASNMQATDGEDASDAPTIEWIPYDHAEPPVHPTADEEAPELTSSSSKQKSQSASAVVASSVPSPERTTPARKRPKLEGSGRPEILSPEVVIIEDRSSVAPQAQSRPIPSKPSARAKPEDRSSVAPQAQRRPLPSKPSARAKSGASKTRGSKKRSGNAAATKRKRQQSKSKAAKNAKAKRAQPSILGFFSKK